jgi:tight adherence protein C
MSTQVLAGAALVGVALPIAWASVSGRRSTTVSAEILGRGFGPSVDVRSAVLDQSVQDRAVGPAVASLAKHARRITPSGMTESLERKLVAAGKQGDWTIEQVLALKVVLLVLTAFVGLVWFASSPGLISLVFAIAAITVGWFGPDGVLDSRAGARRKAVQHELPDTMDQVTIAVEAGLAFEAALARVAANKGSVFANELARTLQDIQLGVPRSEALDGLATRCDTPELRHFVSAVKQAERYGVPIANILRVQSSELREKRRQAAEEHAMKIPVKVLFPLIFCILPTLFIVMVGPAAIGIARGFGG